MAQEKDTPAVACLDPEDVRCLDPSSFGGKRRELALFNWYEFPTDAHFRTYNACLAHKKRALLREQAGVQPQTLERARDLLAIGRAAMMREMTHAGHSAAAGAWNLQASARPNREMMNVLAAGERSEIPIGRINLFKEATAGVPPSDGRVVIPDYKNAIPNPPPPPADDDDDDEPPPLVDVSEPTHSATGLRIIRSGSILLPAPPAPAKPAPEPDLCLMCARNPKQIVVVPCGHMYACQACISAMQPVRCMCCRRPVDNLVLFKPVKRFSFE